MLYHFITGEKDAIHPKNQGTKVGAHYTVTVPPGGKAVIRCRLYDIKEAPQKAFGSDCFDKVFELRKKETDIYYDKVGITFT